MQHLCVYIITTKVYKNPPFYRVHDCFATTADKVEKLKIILASVYTDIYLNNKYILQFDIFNHLENYNITVDRKKKL